jgi:hypothetical protein
MTVNRLILGDNLEILKNMEKDSVDLIYLGVCRALPFSMRKCEKT